MTDALLKNVLLCIKRKLPFSTLASKNYTYGQIADAVIIAAEEKYIEYIDKQYIITQKGEDIYCKIKPFEPKRINKRYYRTDKLSIDDVYLPKNNGILGRIQ